MDRRLGGESAPAPPTGKSFRFVRACDARFRSYVVSNLKSVGFSPYLLSFASRACIFDLLRIQESFPREFFKRVLQESSPREFAKTIRQAKFQREFSERVTQESFPREFSKRFAKRVSQNKYQREFSERVLQESSSREFKKRIRRGSS